MYPQKAKCSEAIIGVRANNLEGIPWLAVVLVSCGCCNKNNQET